MNGNVQVVFFDIGATLGATVLDSSGAPIALDIYAYVAPVLQRLKQKGLRIGVISNTGQHPGSVITDLLSRTEIWANFDTELLIYSADVALEKNSPKIFLHASQVASVEPRQCLYVGEDAWERMHAATAGMQISPHPLLAEEIVNGAKVRFVRLSPPATIEASQLRSALQGKPFVPFTISNLAALANAQIEVETLGPADAPLLSDLYLLRDDRAARTGYLSFEGQSATYFGAGEQANWLVASTADGLLVVLPSGRSVEELHFEEAYHGHNLKLAPDMSLLTSFDAALTGTSFLPVMESSSELLSETELNTLSQLMDTSIQKHLAAYIGKKPLSDGKPVRSRHIHSSDNERVVKALAAHFSSISDELRVRLHPFTHEGRQLCNVEAELGPNDFAEVVLVTAHLDSTAAFSPPYDAKADPAPGADDDASGVAGVLAIAEALSSLAKLKAPEKAVRFVLFNAEEHGLVGSKAYARDLASKAVPVFAVLQMDMIGYNVNPPRSWEVHAGYWPSPEVQDRSFQLAQRISRLVGQISPGLLEPQIYISSGPMRADRDPAEGRSDHASFHERGYAGIVASEDFFAGPNAQAPEPEGNPHYHQKDDTFVDASYAADIARVIAGAAWTIAR